MADEKRLTEKHYDGKGYYMRCSEHCRKTDCEECEKLDVLVDRLGKLEGKEERRVDAVEVVRCKDCKRRDGCLCPMYDYGEFPWLPTADDGFCSFGEKNTNTEEEKHD